MLKWKLRSGEEISQEELEQREYWLRYRGREVPFRFGKLLEDRPDAQAVMFRPCRRAEERVVPVHLLLKLIEQQDKAAKTGKEVA